MILSTQPYGVEPQSFSESFTPQHARAEAGDRQLTTDPVPNNTHISMTALYDG